MKIFMYLAAAVVGSAVISGTSFYLSWLLFDKGDIILGSAVGVVSLFVTFALLHTLIQITALLIEIRKLMKNDYQS